MADKARLTPAGIDNLQAHPDGRRKVYWDDKERGVKGLCLRVTADGVKTFSVWYRVQGQTKGSRYTLPRYDRDIYTLADARKKAKWVLNQAANGIDPAADKRRARQAATFGTLVASFLKDQESALRPATFITWTSLLNHERLATLRGQKTSTITRNDLVRLFDKIKTDSEKEGGKGYSANRTLEAVRRVYRWAVDKGLVERATSPFLDPIKKPVAKEKPRTRSFNDSELGAIVRDGLDDSTQSDAVRLVLFTGVRIEQALGAPWKEFDLEAKEWTIPPDRTGNKSGVEWKVPLVKEAVDMLKARANDSAWVFPSNATKDKPATRLQKSMVRIAEKSRVVDADGEPEFRPHDLRRCINSWLASKGIPQPVRDAILGHRPPGLEGTYNVHAYAKEKRKALERWAEHVARCAASKPENKVLQMAARA